MSGDEFFVMIAATISTFFLWGSWVVACFTVKDFGRARAVRSLALFAPLIALAGLFAVLNKFASYDVRDDALYLFFYLVLGAAWLGAVRQLSGLLGLALRDDWLERRNPAAAAAATGVLVGGTAAYAGANIGDGPGWWVVVFCGLISTVAMCACWWIHAKLSGIIENITLDRDPHAGLRFGSFIAAVGVIAGRTVAGDWHDSMATIVDFMRSAWPLLPYTMGVALIERGGSRAFRSKSATGTAGWMIIHGGAAVLYLYGAGSWK